MFLDEIGDMSSPLQAKLLQVLQDGEFSRLGGKHDVRVDVRVVAATNRDLEQAVADGQFREDLFFRLNVVCITLPPLRERREEIPILADYFLKKYSVQYNKPCAEHLARHDAAVHGVRLAGQHPRAREPDQARGRARHRSADPQGDQRTASRWPRRSQPRSRRRRSPPAPAAVAPHQPRTAGRGRRRRLARRVDDAGRDRDARRAEAGNYSLKDISRTAAREAERELIFKMLQQTRWNRKETAEILGISYKALLYKIKENGLDKAS